MKAKVPERYSLTDENSLNFHRSLRVVFSYVYMTKNRGSPCSFRGNDLNQFSVELTVLNAVYAAEKT